MRHPLAACAAIALLALAGCSSGPAGGDRPPATLPAQAAFGPMTLLTTEGPGFEPSIDVGPDGTVYAAAAKTRRPNEGTTLSSWLWHSRDNGTTWRRLPSLMGAHELTLGLEGDGAVDAVGRYYFVDTYLPDNSIHRWSPSPAGPQWDFSRQVQGTFPVLDDRPWLTAQGDGVVHLMSNNAADPPARMMLSTSLDGGLTWLQMHSFPGANFCQLAASPADDRTVVVACMHGAGSGATLRIHRTSDQAFNWEKEFETPMETGAGYLPPGVAIDAAGNAFVVWHDDRVDWSGVQDVAWAGETPGKVGLARSLGGGAWQAFDVTPFEGRFGLSHACAGRAGTAATIFYATTDLTPNDESEWKAYTLVSADADAPEPTWTLAAMSDEVMAKGAIPPRDLFECSIGPDNAVQAVLQQNTDRWPDGTASGIEADVFHVRQVEGPNLST